MSNSYSAFQKLFQKNVVFIGLVISHGTDGRSTVQTPDGAFYRPLGTTVPIGTNAFVENNVVISTAPNLPTYSATV